MLYTCRYKLAYTHQLVLVGRYSDEDSLRKDKCAELLGCQTVYGAGVLLFYDVNAGLILVHGI